MLNWEGWAATNFVGWGSVGSATPPVVVAPTVGGVGKKRRLKTFHYVVIDGEEIEVGSVAEARAMLDKVREDAKRAAEVATKPVKPVVVAQKPQERPTAATHQIQAQVDATNAVLELIAKEHQKAHELRMRKQEADDEADLLTILDKMNDMGLL
jgi:hypothetical protein